MLTYSNLIIKQKKKKKIVKEAVDKAMKKFWLSNDYDYKLIAYEKKAIIEYKYSSNLMSEFTTFVAKRIKEFKHLTNYIQRFLINY